MADAARHDAHDPAVLAWARAFAGLPRPGREEAILRFVQRCIRYERDPAWYDREGHRHGIEVLDSSAVALQRGYGDCDVKARLFVALCLATGVQAEIDPVFRGENGFPHVRARVLAPDGGRWQTADPTIVNSTIGKLPRHPLTALPREDA
jgi:transglutaminase-like putative cysteine protease